MSEIAKLNKEIKESEEVISNLSHDLVHHADEMEAVEGRQRSQVAREYAMTAHSMFDTMMEKIRKQQRINELKGLLPDVLLAEELRIATASRNRLALGPHPVIRVRR